MLYERDLQGDLLGIVRAAITEAVGPDLLQELEPRVRTLPLGDQTPRWLEISLAYQGRSARSLTPLHDVPTHVALDDEVEVAVPPLLEEIGLLPQPAPVQRARPNPEHAAHHLTASQDPVLTGHDVPKSMGQLYPRNDILAVVDDRATAEQAVEALREVGIPDEDVDLLEGARFVVTVRGMQHHRTLLQRAEAMLAADEGAIIQEYVEEAEQGHYILIVHAAQSEVVERVRGVLADHGGHDIRHFGRFVIADL